MLDELIHLFFMTNFLCVKHGRINDCRSSFLLMLTSYTLLSFINNEHLNQMYDICFKNDENYFQEDLIFYSFTSIEVNEINFGTSVSLVELIPSCPSTLGN